MVIDFLHYGQSCTNILLNNVIRVADIGIHSFFHWIPALRAGMTPFVVNSLLLYDYLFILPCLPYLVTPLNRYN
ncbi:MAG: hypothetical protein PG980_000100 [Wolbachia endosymbiont of Ctenocephalides felis wCfeJ]|nr:MAG: hypothetical protein PG980_000100 [Wolbachia endosymbiont of Ctenocephalides felis wCfeJ]